MLSDYNKKICVRRYITKRDVGCQITDLVMRYHQNSLLYIILRTEL